MAGGPCRPTVPREPILCTRRRTSAVKRARQLAENKQTELVIKNEKGRIVEKDSHGNDPRRIKG
jgi:hypothetical protein